MDVGGSIGRIEGLVGRVGDACPAVASDCAAALRSIKASGRRACMGEPRISAAARATVACSAMAVVCGAVEAGGLSRATGFLLSGLASEAVALSPDLSPEHVAALEASAPPGWRGAGPFHREGPDGIQMTLSHRPMLPGGDWTVYYGPVPAAYGDTPESAAAMAARLCAALSSGRLAGRPGLPLRRVTGAGPAL